MARGRVPLITAEERARNRRMADERMQAVCAEQAERVQATARAWLVEAGALVLGEGVGERLRRLSRYRQTLMQTSAQNYRPTFRQQIERACPGVDVEIEF